MLSAFKRTVAHAGAVSRISGRRIALRGNKTAGEAKPVDPVEGPREWPNMTPQERALEEADAAARAAKEAARLAAEAKRNATTPAQFPPVEKWPVSFLLISGLKVASFVGVSYLLLDEEPARSWVLASNVWTDGAETSGSGVYKDLPAYVESNKELGLHKLGLLTEVGNLQQMHVNNYLVRMGAGTAAMSCLTSQNPNVASGGLELVRAFSTSSAMAEEVASHFEKTGDPSPLLQTFMQLLVQPQGADPDRYMEFCSICTQVIASLADSDKRVADQFATEGEGSGKSVIVEELAMTASRAGPLEFFSTMLRYTTDNQKETPHYRVGFVEHLTGMIASLLRSEKCQEKLRSIPTLQSDLEYEAQEKLSYQIEYNSKLALARLTGSDVSAVEKDNPHTNISVVGTAFEIASAGPVAFLWGVGRSLFMSRNYPQVALKRWSVAGRCGAVSVIGMGAFVVAELLVSEVFKAVQSEDPSKVEMISSGAVDTGIFLGLVYALVQKAPFALVPVLYAQTSTKLFQVQVAR